MRIVTIIRTALLLSAVSALPAQWLNQRTPGIPRTPDGKPNLSAPAPRTPGGKPDLSGVWSFDGIKYVFNAVRDLKPGDTQPWADALFQQRAVDLGKDDPSDIHCLPQGPRANLYPLPEKIVQTPNLIVMLMEDLTYRQIFLDGRELPKDPNPSFMGYSVGHWDGDTLVVESAGFNDRLWLDLAGHPFTEAMQITERFQRTDFGHMQIEETISDPKTYIKPIVLHLNANFFPDTDLLEYVCPENERDGSGKHLVGKATDDQPGPVRLAPEALAKYVGTYDFRTPESPNVPVLIHVTLSDGQLFFDLYGAPLIPLSETAFSGGVTFFTDSKGVVTHLTVQAPEGDLRAVRLRDGK
jgi:hypothetical protein